MGSLWSSVRKADYLYGFSGFSQEECEALFDKILNVTPVLVNIQSIADMRLGTELAYSVVAQDIAPCHRELWLEYKTRSGCRQSIWVSRLEESAITPTIRQHFEPPPQTRLLVHFTTFIEHQGAAGITAMTFAYVDGDGRPLADKERETDNPQHSRSTYFLACDVLSTMNTRGSRIEPPLKRPKAEIVKPNRAPHSVWHTIHLPSFPAPPLTDVEVSSDVLERRQHWVRAHRKDYRQGAGMFGRVKALVWVPEHQRGNPELGTVKQSFAVNSQQTLDPGPMGS
jgi:hypothetical protein